MHEQLKAAYTSSLRADTAGAWLEDPFHFFQIREDCMQVAVPRGKEATRWEWQNVRHGGSVNGMLYIYVIYIRICYMYTYI